MIQIPIGIDNTPHNNKMLTDMLKVFTVAVVREVVTSYSNNTKMFSEKWVNITLTTLFGFFVFYVFVVRNINFKLNDPVEKQEAN
jgi:hypothetical protein